MLKSTNIEKTVQRKDVGTQSMHRHMLAINAFLQLVGNKSDLREQKQDHCVTDEEVEAVAKEVGAVCYLPCSALHLKNVTKVFDTAVRTCIDFRRPQKKKKSKGMSSAVVFMPSSALP